MIRLLLFALPLLMLLSCGGDKTKQAKKSEVKVQKANITFEVKPVDGKTKVKLGERSLGRAKTGETLNDSFALKNLCDKPLIILSTSSNCGCIFMDYNTSPIMKEESRVIKYRYKTGGKVGPQFSEVTFTTNMGKYIILFDIDIRK